MPASSAGPTRVSTSCPERGARHRQQRAPAPLTGRRGEAVVLRVEAIEDGVDHPLKARGVEPGAGHAMGGERVGELGVGHRGGAGGALVCARERAVVEARAWRSLLAPLVARLTGPALLPLEVHEAACGALSTTSGDPRRSHQSIKCVPALRTHPTRS
jgi:hypothetical protein